MIIRILHRPLSCLCGGVEGNTHKEYPIILGKELLRRGGGDWQISYHVFFIKFPVNLLSKSMVSLLILTGALNANLLFISSAAQAVQPRRTTPQDLQERNKYFLCDPLTEPEPTVNEVKSCIEKIKTTWESSWLPAVRSKQRYLITRQNTGSILQWVGVSGGAAAATLGISNPKNSGTTAIVLGSASVLTAVTGLIWKQESSNSRIAKCTDVLSKQYKIQASLETWYLQANSTDFRKSFLEKVKTEFIDYVLPGLEGCMPGDWIYQS